MTGVGATQHRNLVAQDEDLGVLGRVGAGETSEGRFTPRTVTIALLDENRAAVCRFVLQRAQPKRWVGPTLAAKGGGEVAMEELHLVAERITFEA
jgi:hypothetical protein